MTRYAIDPERMTDISMTLQQATPVWPGDTPFTREAREEDGFRTSRIIMSTHSGTHMDAPAHIASCSATIDEMTAFDLILPAVVADCTVCRTIEADSISELELNGRALLLKTLAGNGPCSLMEYGHLSEQAARTAVDMGVRAVGTDALSVDPPGCADVHGILLKASVPIIENLVLGSTAPGGYLLFCFPLKIGSADGSPVRAFLHPLRTLSPAGTAAGLRDGLSPSGEEP